MSDTTVVPADWASAGVPDWPGPAADRPTTAAAPSTPAPRTASADDWDNVRDGSISRRPAWRRPRPSWLVPFIIGLTTSIGMTLAPRAELYLDLACLAHPPQASDNVSVGVLGMRRVSWQMSSPAPADGVLSPSAIDRVLTPGEKWFMDAQKSIFGVPSTGDLPAAPREPLPLPNGTDTGVPGESDGDGPGSPPPGGPASPNPFPEIDPALCKTDKTVVAAAARLTMSLIIAGGLLSALTTGAWAAKSDAVGRTTVLSLVEVGWLLNDLFFLIVVSYPRLLKHFGLYILLIGPTLEGLFGGISAHSATMHAYCSDVTPDGSRVTVFTRVAAFIMVGFAVGPYIGSTLIRITDNILAPFYITIGVHLLFVLLVRFVVPESLSSDSRAQLVKRADAAAQRRREREEAEIAAELEDTAAATAAGESGWSIAGVGLNGAPRRRAVGVLRRFAYKCVHMFRPLSIFKPRPKDDGSGHHDYNLLLVGIGTFLIALLQGVLQVKANYTFYAFGWGQAQLGPYISFLSTCRFLVLVVLMPVIVYYIKPYYTEPAVIEHQSNDPDASPWRATRDASPRAVVSERTPLLKPGNGPHASGSSAAQARSSSPTDSARSASSDSDDEGGPKAKPKAKRSAALDLTVVRVSALFEICGYVVLALNTARSAHVFVVTTAVLTLGSSVGAASNSLALSFVRHQRETGRLFGSLAVLQALGSALAAPLLFNTVFAWGVENGYAEAVFMLAAAVLVVAVVVYLLVHLPHHSADEERGRGRGLDRGRGRGRAGSPA